MISKNCENKPTSFQIYIRVNTDILNIYQKLKNFWRESVMKIAFFEVNKVQQEAFQKAFKNDELYFFEGELSQDALGKACDAEVISVFVCSLVTKSVLDFFPYLKLIATRSTGYDHIDLEAAAQRNIVVCNVPIYADVAVAEYAFALLLSLSRKIYEACYRVEHEHSFSLKNLQGFDLSGKTLGVIGTGNIGKHVIKIAKGFNMHVLACDIFPDEAFAKYVGFEYMNFIEVLKNSDVISLHVPLNKKTYHMINLETIDYIKQGAYVINTARGGLIETQALIKALSKGIISGAALDVIEQKCSTLDPLPLFFGQCTTEQRNSVLGNYYLIQHPRVLVSPHNAFNSAQADERLIKTTIENIESWKHNAPINLIVKN
jgi:D-lactate dehydrogenase